MLRNGDFYPFEEKEKKWDQVIGRIKPFAWSLLVQAGKLADLSGKRLALTKAGRAALTVAPADTLKLLWERWLKNKLLDEFNRINDIKGQQGKGKRSFTATEGRREVIQSALQQCPVNQWLAFDEFARFMQAAAYDFEVTRDPWSLYIVDQQYGSLGYAGYHDWPILQGRYVLCLLFEYAATLGLIDVAYTHPSYARDDFGDMWGADELHFLSRYDGLRYFRVNALGAYCLGLSGSYSLAGIEAKASFNVMPSLQIKVAGALSMDEAMMLETWALKENDESWRLDRDKVLSHLETGGNLTELREFLAVRDEQELPDSVVAFFITTERNAKALKSKGTALLIECASAEIAAEIASHERLKKLCQRAGDKHLVVKESEEEAFRKAVHLLGYGMPR